MIPERRKERPDKGNIFAIVEIKFESDRIEKEQFEQYNRLLDQAATVKTDRSRMTLEGKAVNKGGDLALFRYPLDVAVMPGSESSESDEQRRKKRTGGGR